MGTVQDPNSKLPTGKTGVDQSVSKPRYVAPDFRAEPVFETAALTCGKVVRNGHNCRSTKC